MYITTTLIRKYFDSTRFVDALFSFRSSLARLVMKCDMQISYEMVSIAHVHQLTMFHVPLIKTKYGQYNNRRIRTHESASEVTVRRLGKTIQRIFFAPSGASIRRAA